MNEHRAGFSLIEALIATLILGVLLTVALVPIGNLFHMAKSTQQQLDNNTLAQQVTERILNAWRDPARFDAGCLDLGSTPLPLGVSATVQPLDANAVPAGPATPLANCPASGTLAPLKRLHVVADAGGPKAEVVLDVARPGGGP